METQNQPTRNDVGGGGKTKSNHSFKSAIQPKSILKKKVCFTENQSVENSQVTQNQSQSVPKTTSPTSSFSKTSKLTGQAKKPNVRSNSLKLQSCKDLQQVFQKINLPELVVPVVDKPFFDSNYGSLVPFYSQKDQTFAVPYPLQSIGNFSSNDEYSFIKYSFNKQRLSYQDQPDQLLATMYQQRNQIYSEGLCQQYRQTIRNNNQACQFFTKSLMMIGTLLEYTQTPCANHLKWQTVPRNFICKKTNKPYTEPLQVIPVPVTNKSRRNVLDREGDQLFTKEEFDMCLEVLSKSEQSQSATRIQMRFFFKSASVTNRKVTQYTDTALSNLFQASSTDEIAQIVKRLNSEKGANTVYGEDDRSQMLESEKSKSQKDCSKFNQERALCNIPIKSNKVHEPATSFNAFFQFDSLQDYIVKQTNSSQLIGQQITRNPVDMLNDPSHIYNSVQTCLSGDMSNFINTSVFYVGSYADQNSQNPKPKVDTLSARVTPRMLVKIDTVSLSTKVNTLNKKKQDNPNFKQGLLVRILCDIFEQFKSQANKQYRDKVEFLNDCRPIIAITATGENKRFQLTTNIRFYGQLLFIRKPRRKDLFKQEFFNQARKEIKYPTLFDVVQMMKNQPTDWNLNDDFVDLNQIAPNAKKKFDFTQSQRDCLTYHLLVLLANTCSENGMGMKEYKNLTIREISIFILVQDSNLSVDELVRDHQLAEMAGSDFGQHTSIATRQQNLEYVEIYKKLILGQKVELPEDYLKHTKRFTDASYKNMLRWTLDSRKLLLIGPEDLLTLSQAYERHSEVMKKFNKSVIDKIKCDNSIQTSTALLISSLEQLSGQQTFEDGFIALKVAFYFYLYYKKVISQDDGMDITLMIEFFQSVRLIPFYILTEQLTPQIEDRGMLPTQHMISLSTNLFETCLKRSQKGFELLTLNLTDGSIGTKTAKDLAKCFYQSLFRLMRFYLVTQGRFLQEQLLTVIQHKESYKNFAFLIKSGIDPKLSLSDIEIETIQIQVMQCEQSIFKSELVTSIDVFEHQIRQDLYIFLADKHVPTQDWPSDLQLFAAKQGMDAQSSYRIPRLAQSSHMSEQQIERIQQRKRDLKFEDKNAIAHQKLLKANNIYLNQTDLPHQTTHQKQGASLSVVVAKKKSRNCSSQSSVRSSKCSTNNQRKSVVGKRKRSKSQQSDQGSQSAKKKGRDNK